MGSRETDRNNEHPEPNLNPTCDEPSPSPVLQSAENSSASQNPDEVALSSQSAEEALDERRKIRRLQMMMDMVMSVIGQDEKLTVEEAAELIADSKKAALAMFPDKELAYNIIYKPRLQRLMRERYRIQ
ncbi:MAG TPA: hypothetical protein VGM27_15730 [Acidobacteriaceae bacterium]|jgi:hypothetical protein